MNTLKLFILLYADDIVILAETDTELQTGLNILKDYCSYASPIRVAPPVSSHEYSNASKFNPKSAVLGAYFNS